MNSIDNPWPILALLVGCMSVIIATRFRAGPQLSPFSISMVMLMANFGVRPTHIDSDPSHGFYGYTIERGTNFAAFIGFVGVCGLAAGFYFREVILGIVGVVAVTVVLGWVSRVFEERILFVDGYVLLGLIIFGSLPATVVRGSFPAQLWIGLNILVVALILVKAATLLRPHSGRRTATSDLAAALTHK